MRWTGSPFGAVEELIWAMRRGYRAGWRLAARAVYAAAMCRNIRTLHNFEPAATSDEIRAAALQYVRKVSGSTKPSKANAEVFDRAVDEIAHITAHLLDDLVAARAAEGPRGRGGEGAGARPKRFAA